MRSDDRSPRTRDRCFRIARAIVIAPLLHRSVVVGASLTAALLLDAPVARAEAQNQVHIVSCTAITAGTNTPLTNDGVQNIDPLTIGGIEIAFVDEAPATADAVTFAVSYAGKRQLAVDRGHFSRGVMIHHTLTLFTGELYAGERPDTCTVDRIHFENGTNSV